MLKRDGVPEWEDIQRVLPKQDRRKSRPYVVVECFEEIPCDPCYESCPFNAFKPFKHIKDLPEVDFEKCTGCGICIAYCPGLAIFVVDETNEEFDLVSIPYEFLPLPDVDEKGYGLTRTGERICIATVHRVKKIKNKTHIVTIRVPKGLGNKVRHYVRKI